MDDPFLKNLSCPISIEKYPNITLAHGGGGRMSDTLIRELFHSAFANEVILKHCDSAVVTLPRKNIAMTTDSYVVSPLFFPGGDIGKIAVHGTINDLAMSGARPFYISAAFILEEGFPIEKLWKIVLSMKQAADESEVQIIAGDTKVVDKGKCDGVFITTTGVGVIEHNLDISPKSIAVGDTILLSGDIGRHGIAIISAREELDMSSTIESDSAPLWAAVCEMLQAGINIHCLRDLTRGGLASALVEIAETSKLHFNVKEREIQVHEKVRGVSEFLGFDPLHIANEGRFIAIVAPKDSNKALEILRAYNAAANTIGHIDKKSPRRVTLETVVGTRRIVDMLSGEQLPRIC